MKPQPWNSGKHARGRPRRGRCAASSAKRIVENAYNLTLASLGLVEPEKTDHAEPEDILASVAEKERRILALVDEMKALLEAET